MRRHTSPAAWEVEFTDEFGAWWARLSEGAQEDIDTCVRVLERKGPHLGYPYSSDVRGAKHANLRELRVQHAGRHYRVLYAFDPRRTAILLIGGDKTGNSRWYDEYVPVADRLSDEHLVELRKEGWI